MTLTDQELDAWSTAYIEIQRLPDCERNPRHPLWWAVQRFQTYETREQCEDIWSGILRVVSETSDDDVLGVLAAGPLEDLVSSRGHAFIDRIEQQARLDPTFRLMLEGMWECGSPDLWARIVAAREP